MRMLPLWPARPAMLGSGTLGMCLSCGPTMGRVRSSLLMFLLLHAEDGEEKAHLGVLPGPPQGVMWVCVALVVNSTYRSIKKVVMWVCKEIVVPVPRLWTASGMKLWRVAPQLLKVVLPLLPPCIQIYYRECCRNGLRMDQWEVAANVDLRLFSIFGRCAYMHWSSLRELCKSV